MHSGKQDWHRFSVPTLQGTEEGVRKAPLGAAGLKYLPCSVEEGGKGKKTHPTQSAPNDSKGK